MCAPYAAEHDPAEAERLFTFEALEASYRECRKRKRGTRNALRFELNLEENLLELAEDLRGGRYRPLRSVCFVTTRPKCREIVAADFRDRVVHHFLVRRLEPLWERVFIHDSYASRKGKGNHAAVDRLVSFIPKVTENHTRKAWYAHLDIRSFFTSIDHERLLEILWSRSRSPTMNWLCERIVRRDIRPDAVRKGNPERFHRVPPGKSLLRGPGGKGLPIGNHTSQFFANVYLNELDQFVKHGLHARFSIRYVDDLILLSRTREEFLAWRDAIDAFLREKLLLELNPNRCRIAPLSSGVDFLGYIVHPHHRLVRRRVVGNLKARLSALEKRLTEDRGGYAWVLYREGESEYLRSMIASYRAHFLRADTRRLRSRIREEHPWLVEALGGPSGKPFWDTPAVFPCLGAQAHRFQQTFPEALVAIQVGRFWEFYGRRGAEFARRARLKLLRGRRAGSRRWTRVPLEPLDRLLGMLRRAGVRDVVLVRQGEAGVGPVLPRRAAAIGRWRGDESEENLVLRSRGSDGDGERRKPC